MSDPAPEPAWFGWALVLAAMIGSILGVALEKRRDTCCVHCVKTLFEEPDDSDRVDRDLEDDAR